MEYWKYYLGIILGAFGTVLLTKKLNGKGEKTHYYFSAGVTIFMGILTLSASGYYRALGYTHPSWFSEINRLIFILVTLTIGVLILIALITKLPDGIKPYNQNFGWLFMNIALAFIFVAVGFTIVFFNERYEQTSTRRFDILLKKYNEITERIDDNHSFTGIEIEAVIKNNEELYNEFRGLRILVKDMDTLSRKVANELKEKKRIITELQIDDMKLLRILELDFIQDLISSTIFLILGTLMGRFFRKA